MTNLEQKKKTLSSGSSYLQCIVVLTRPRCQRRGRIQFQTTHLLEAAAYITQGNGKHVLSQGAFDWGSKFDVCFHSFDSITAINLTAIGLD